MNNASADLTIVVNSSDGFEDCWIPFFTLFAKHWPQCPYPLVLNTEKKQYQHPGLHIVSSQVAAGESRRLTWSECLMRCLDRIDTPLVLYLQEDFFLEAAVQTQTLESLIAPLRDGSADVVRVMECGGAGPWHATANPLLWRVDQQAAYRISLQAVLWRKSTLRQHLRKHESPWQLEVFGSARARRLKTENVLCVNRDQFHGPGKEVIPYTPTGVVKGKWEKFVPALFEREGIRMDYSQRGFYEPGQPSAKAPLINRVADRLRSLV
jgi:hypothetical protein